MPAALKKQDIQSVSHPLNIMIGRQPIYNNNMGVYGYELLYRSRDNSIADMDPDHATAQVLSSLVNNFGLDNLVKNGRAAINITEKFLPNIKDLPLPPERILLDLPTNIQITEQLIRQIQELVALGFEFSVDGLINIERLKVLLSLVGIVRIDIHQIESDKLEKLLTLFSEYRNVELLAIKIESLEEYHECRDMGFKYCQGYFLSKPRVYLSKDLPPNQLSVLNLLAAVNNEQTDVKELEQLVSQDVSLSYKLLKLINSPFFGMRNQIESIGQALVLLGRTELRTWISLVALSDMGDKPDVMIELALVRAKMCELLAEKAGLNAGSYFTAGMMSALDILMECPIKVLLNALPLSDAIKEAILNQSGQLGEALRCAIAYENSDWDFVSFGHLKYDELLDAYMQAIAWSGELLDHI